MNKTLLATTLLITAIILSATGIEVYQDIQVTIPNESFCTQNLGLAYISDNMWLPVANGTIYLNPTSSCVTNSKGYCNLTVERDKVYAVKHNNNTVKLFIGCQEVLIVIRV